MITFRTPQESSVKHKERRDRVREIEKSDIYAGIDEALINNPDGGTIRYSIDTGYCSTDKDTLDEIINEVRRDLVSKKWYVRVDDWTKWRLGCHKDIYISAMPFPPKKLSWLERIFKR